MKQIISYLLSVFLLGTFTALIGGGSGVLTAFAICYCFWGSMLAPMLIKHN